MSHPSKTIVAGRKLMLSKNEVIYEEPDLLQPNNIGTKDRDVELKEGSDYNMKPTREADIKLEDCPAYVEQKDKSIRLEECPAYGELKRDFNISLDVCPAYEQIANLNSK